MTQPAKHTPQWYAANMGNDHQGLVVDEQTGRNVAVAYDKSDVHMLAAAPAMYEALKGMVTMYDSLNKSNKHDGACPCYHCQARAALAQADGKQ
jgi:hypothetical protein